MKDKVRDVLESLCRDIYDFDYLNYPNNIDQAIIDLNKAYAEVIAKKDLRIKELESWLKEVVKGNSARNYPIKVKLKNNYAGLWDEGEILNILCKEIDEDCSVCATQYVLMKVSKAICEYIRSKVV